MRALKFALVGTAAFLCQPLVAQDAAGNAAEDTDYLAALKSCQSQNEDTARLACFDKAVGSMVTANEAGEVQVLDKDDLEKTRRRLFGFTLPKIGLFGDSHDDDSEEAKKKRNLLETVITSVSYSGRNTILFKTEEGATWKIPSAPSRLRTVKVGQSVVLKKAAMGSFFIRIAGQTGVKGLRVR